MMKWENFAACPVCGDDNASYFGTGEAPVLQFDNILGGAPLAVLSAYVVCNGCGLIFQHTHMTAESMNEFYASGMYRASLRKPEEELDASERRTAEKIYREVIPGGSHLDVGCSRGYLLAKTRDELGCRVFGVEPNANWVTQDVQTARDIADVRGQFDTVTCIHVFEHVLDPLLYAAQLVSLVKPGGLLILEVPSLQSPGGWLRLPHTFAFNPWVIRRIFGGMHLVKFEVNPHNHFIFRKPLEAQYQEADTWQLQTATPL